MLSFLEQFQLTAEELDWLETSGMFNSKFLEHLATLKFSVNVYAIPEGTVFFANEPITLRHGGTQMDQIN